jgi:hypothetical protein
LLSIIYYRYDFNVASIMINDTTYSLKGDLKFRSCNVCLFQSEENTLRIEVSTTLKLLLQRLILVNYF